MPPKRKRGVDADDDDEKDLQLFRDHRRVYLKTKPGYHKDKTRAASNRMWKEFTQEQKDAKVKRIREAVAAGTALEDLPLEEGKEEKDSSDDGEGNDGEGNDGEGNDGEGNDGEGNNAATNDLEWLPDTNRENDEYADSSSDSNASLGGPAAGVYREDDDADWGTAKLVERKQKARKEYAQKQAPRYNPPTYDNALWKYQRHLGSGRDGSANLWVLVDDNDQILFRIAVKDCWTLGPSFWGSAKFWHGDPHDANTRVPTEVRAMQVCSGQPGGNRIVGILTHSVDDDRMVYRIIMPFYPHGDIISIIDQTEDPFPEAFIWYVFEALTDACLVMQRGTTAKLAPSAPAPVEDWKEIVHRDIKPDNIFLDAPHPTNFPSYPQPVLADFGACIMTSENDALNPTAYADSQGTEGYYAPEQHAYQDRTTFEQVFLARQQSWTNIFQIGRVVLSLMNAPVDDKEDQYLLNGQIVYFLSRDPLYADPKAWKDHRWLKEGAKHRYSKQLAKLVMKCVKYLPNQRIAAQRLKGKILRRTGGVRGAEDFTGGLRGRKRRVGEEGRLRKWMRKERYAVGMVRPEE